MSNVTASLPVRRALPDIVDCVDEKIVIGPFPGSNVGNERASRRCFPTRSRRTRRLGNRRRYQPGGTAEVAGEIQHRLDVMACTRGCPRRGLLLRSPPALRSNDLSCCETPPLFQTMLATEINKYHFALSVASSARSVFFHKFRARHRFFGMMAGRMT